VGLGDDAADCMGAETTQASAVPGRGPGTTHAPGPGAMESASPAADPIASARAAGLRYVSDRAPGITRRRQGNGFAYRLPDGAPLRDRAERRRIEKLAIPPAWTDVWICPDANGHLQATGRDARGRKQYRYHPDWRGVRDETKFGRLIAFGEALPALRRRVEEDLGRPGLPREKVLAAVVRLLETTLLRVGNEEYARANNSFGLTTLRDRHAAVEGSTVRFAFRGKSGKEVEVDIQDRRLARVVKRCRELPGQELFQYLDDEGARQAVGSGDVNAYLREVTGEEFSAKDFRTWGGTVLALGALSALAANGTGAGEASRNVVQAVKEVAEQLGNRPAICRKYYIHPGVLDAYVEGVLAGAAAAAETARHPDDGPALSPLERRTLDLLRERLPLSTR
jgi:DNA topoisomerase I